MRYRLVVIALLSSAASACGPQVRSQAWYAQHLDPAKAEIARCHALRSPGPACANAEHAAAAAHYNAMEATFRKGFQP